MLSRKWVWTIVAAYLAAALGFAALMATQVPFAPSPAERFGQILGIAIGVYAVSAVIPITIWAFLRFSLNNATGPLVLWGFLLIGLCGAFYFRVTSARDTAADKLATVKDTPSLRASFVRDYTRFCLGFQSKDPDNQKMGFSKDQIEWYCRCGAERLLQRTTLADWQYIAQTGQFSKNTVDKQKQTAAECIEDMRQSGRLNTQPQSPFGPEWKEIPADKPQR